MTYYRVFTLSNTNNINGVEIIECETDQQALAEAPSVMGDKKQAEVWEGERPIGRVGQPQKAG
jgi:hypothetical protein